MDLERVRRLLIDPIVVELKQELGNLRRDVVEHRNTFERYLDKNHGDHETRLRAIEDGLLPKWMLPAIGTIVAIAAALASHVAWR